MCKNMKVIIESNGKLKGMGWKESGLKKNQKCAVIEEPKEVHQSVHDLLIRDKPKSQNSMRLNVSNFV